MFESTQAGETIIDILTKHAEFLKKLKALNTESVALSEKNKTEIHCHFHDLLQVGKEMLEFEKKLTHSKQSLDQVKELFNGAQESKIADSSILKEANESAKNINLILNQLFDEIASLKNRFNQANNKFQENSVLIRENIKKAQEEQDNFLNKIVAFKLTAIDKEKQSLPAITRLEEGIDKDKAIFSKYDKYLDLTYQKNFNRFFETHTKTLTDYRSFFDKIGDFKSSEFVL